LNPKQSKSPLNIRVGRGGAPEVSGNITKMEGNQRKSRNRVSNNGVANNNKNEERKSKSSLRPVSINGRKGPQKDQDFTIH
jgi:hypothetical protein